MGILRSFFLCVRRAVWQTLVHDGLLVAKAAAYSAIVSLFPAMLVLAAIVAMLPGAEMLRHQIYVAMEQILPESSTHLIGSYFVGSTSRSIASVVSALLISFFAASGVVASLMEGFRRAERIPRAEWRVKRQRIVAFLLVPVSLVPLALAAALVIFGRIIAHTLAEHVDTQVRGLVLLLWLLTRWSVALLTSVAMLAVIYRFSIPHSRRWHGVVPGASLATALWFPTTLAFGWYVTRYANYTAVYGSLGAGIATMAWLYIVCVAALIGAEFNAELGPAAPAQLDTPPAFFED